MRITRFIAVLLVLLASTGSALFAQNSLHPQIVLKDNAGNRVTAATQTVSADKSCTPCHDTAWIEKHNVHNSDTVKVNCIQCHMEGGKLPANVNTAYMKIIQPESENCASCHGAAHDGTDPYGPGSDYEKTISPKASGNPNGITQLGGVVFSPELHSESGLNLKDKDTLTHPFDVHAARDLTCVDCHYAMNAPGRCETAKSDLEYLTFDPRRGMSTKDYLERPDHRLQTAQCQCCHDAFAVHKKLPYKKRHLESMECQSCHVPKLYGPALSAVDQTVVKPDGTPLVEYRNIERQTCKEPFSAMLQEGYQPFLATTKDSTLVAPFNLTAWWYWVDSQGNKVSTSQLRNAMLNGEVYRPEILDVFDKDNSGELCGGELKLDSDEKVAVIKSLLERAGISSPVIVAKVTDYQISHGVVGSSHMTLQCESCHGNNNMFQNDITLASYIPGGVMPEMTLQNSTITGSVEDQSGSVVLNRDSSVKGRYIFGTSRNSIIDILGFLIFVASVIGVSIHGGLRYYLSKKFHAHHGEMKEEYMYSFYERLWHWTMAISILLLIVTGLEVHFTGSFNIFGLTNTIVIHNVLGFIVTINAVMSLFYHIATGEIKQYFSLNKSFHKETISQVFFYVHGIFTGAPHPVPKNTERKLNPLQQVTYVMLLNVMLPFQILTGLLIWGVERNEAISNALNGLVYLGPLHALGSWLFITFVVVHVYLTTTGHTPLANLKAMITGYDEVEVADEKFMKEQDALLKKGFFEVVSHYITQFKDSFKEGGEKK